MNIRFIASKLKEAEEELPRLTTRRVFMARGFGLSLLLGSVGACRVGSRTTKEGHEFFDPADLPWHLAPGFSSGVWERIVSGGRDEGVTTRFLRFDPGSGNDAVVTHDFWEEIYIVSGTFECGARAYAAGCVAVRPPGMPHGPFHSTSGCLNFEVRYRISR
jgi:hypothetical protein